MTSFALDPDELDTGVPIPVADDGKIDCPDCGNRFKANADGSIRSHTCNGVRTVNPRAKAAPAKTRKRANSKDVPASVNRVVPALLATGIEFVASHTVAAAVPCEPHQVPANIEEPDDMIGPLLRLAWPSIPRRAQSLVTSLSEREDLIVCAMAWWAYGQRLTAFQREASKVVKNARQEQTASNVTPIQTGSMDHGFIGQTESLRFDGIRPFEPDASSV